MSFHVYIYVYFCVLCYTFSFLLNIPSFLFFSHPFFLPSLILIVCLYPSTCIRISTYPSICLQTSFYISIYMYILLTLYIYIYIDKTVECLVCGKLFHRGELDLARHAIAVTLLHQVSKVKRAVSNIVFYLGFLVFFISFFRFLYSFLKFFSVST